MENNSPEVRVLINVLTPMIENCTLPLDGIPIEQCLKGVRYMSTEHQEFRNLLTVLDSKMKNFYED